MQIRGKKKKKTTALFSFQTTHVSTVKQSYGLLLEHRKWGSAAGATPGLLDQSGKGMTQRGKGRDKTNETGGKVGRLEPGISGKEAQMKGRRSWGKQAGNCSQGWPALLLCVLM